MKKKIIAVLTASALIASAAMTVSASAMFDPGDLSSAASLDTAITKSGKGEWTIGSAGMALIASDILTGAGLYDIHIELSEEYHDSMTLTFTFRAGGNDFELMYIMMKADQDMHIPVSDIITALMEKYPDQQIPFTELEYIKITDSAGLVSDISLCSDASEGGSLSDTAKTDENEWTIDSDSVKKIITDLAVGGDLYDLHVTLKEDYHDSMHLFIKFHTEDKTYELMYIMMKAEPDMHLQVKDIVTALADQYPDEKIPLDKITYITVSDPAGLVDDILLCDDSGDDEAEDTESDYSDNTAEADTFFAETEEGRRFDLVSPDILMDANGTAGGNVGMKISFEDALDSGFDLRFIFISNDGEKKTVKAYSTKSLSKSGVIVNVRALVAESGMDFMDIAGFTVLNKGDKDITSIDFGMGSDEFAEIRFADSSVDGASEDANPATGVGIASSALLAAVSGAAALLTRKRR